jgi:2-hydroxy-3-oxopropionate reductase
LIGGRAVRIVIDLSTTGPRMEEEIEKALGKAGKILLDCPVSGGAAGAVAGSLTLMLAGDPKAVAEARPVLALFGRHFVVGERPGQGQTLKILNNLMSTAALAIGSEALVLGVKAGLDPDMMLEVINAGTGRSGASLDKLPRHVLTRRFDFGFPIALSAKDARLCLEESDRLGVPMIVGNAVRQLLNITRDRQGPATDLTAMIRTVEEWAGVEVRGKAAEGADDDRSG